MGRPSHCTWYARSQLRADSLAALLLQANIRAGLKVLVSESCLGLVTGAILERLGGLMFPERGAGERRFIYS